MEEYIDLFNRKDDIVKKEGKLILFFIYVLEFFCNKRMVLIIGVQGFGKIYLVKLLVNNLKKNGSKIEIFWIFNFK